MPVYRVQPDIRKSVAVDVAQGDDLFDAAVGVDAKARKVVGFLFSFEILTA